MFARFLQNKHHTTKANRVLTVIFPQKIAMNQTTK